MSGEEILPFREFHERKDIPTIKVGLGEQKWLFRTLSRFR